MSINKAQRIKLKSLGEHVKSLRKEKGLTLKELSHSIGKDPQSIHRLEMGQVNPSYLYLLELCEGLEINVVELLQDLTE
jgi:transcriptional regulator with XRE-family HTH domain